MSIVLVRSDDRLIHGLVVTHWMSHLRFNRAVVIDNTTATNPTLKSILKIAAPPNLKLEVLTESDAVERLIKNEWGKDRVIVLAKNPIIFYRMLDAGWKHLTALNLGPSSYKPNSINVGPNTALLPEEIDACNKMVEKGVHVYVQLVPTERPVEWSNAIRNVEGS